MAVLDMILVKELVDTATTVNGDFESVAVDITNREAECSFQVNYENGIGVNMEISLEVSSDGINYAQIEESKQQIVDTEGIHIVDLFGTGTNYARVKIEVTSGSIDVTRILYSGKRRH